MKASMLFLSLVIAAFLHVSEARATTQRACASTPQGFSEGGSCDASAKPTLEAANKCSAAIKDLQAKDAIVRAAKQEYEHSAPKSRNANLCSLLRFQMEYLVDAKRTLKMCEHAGHINLETIAAKTQENLEKSQIFQRKYCNQVNLARFQ